MPADPKIYDPYSVEMQEDPYPAYDYFREETPCAYNEERDFYALFRFEDVWQATLDWETYSSSLGPPLENRGEMPGEMFSIIGMDPPRHVRVRTMISKGFTPRRINALDEQVKVLVDQYMDRVVEAGPCDFQENLSNRLPMDVISTLLGIPTEARDGYREAVDMGLSRDPETGEAPAGAKEAGIENRQYLMELLRKRREDPQDDLISVLAAAEYEDIDGETKRLTDSEAVAFIGLLAAAGSETTTKLLGNCMVYLHRFPDQRQLLWDDPSLIPDAIEEILRYDTPSQFQGRVVMHDVEAHGVKIPKNARLAMVTGAACRDPREYDDPDELDIRRTRTRELSFGYGQHICIGKSLARLETRLVLEAIRERMPNYEIDESGLTRTYQAHVRGFATVPVRF